VEKTPEKAFERFNRVQTQCEEAHKRYKELDREWNLSRKRWIELTELCRNLAEEAESMLIDYIREGKRTRQQLKKYGMPSETVERYFRRAGK
jgi:chemotaxis regulatin CheY-phosphate phosphatase CheZ